MGKSGDFILITGVITPYLHHRHLTYRYPKLSYFMAFPRPIILGYPAIGFREWKKLVTLGPPSFDFGQCCFTWIFRWASWTAGNGTREVSKSPLPGVPWWKREMAGEGAKNKWWKYPEMVRIHPFSWGHHWKNPRFFFSAFWSFNKTNPPFEKGEKHPLKQFLRETGSRHQFWVVLDVMLP